MNFTIKGFKTWNTDDGGGYQFNLYLDNKKFAYVHNDGNGGMIDMSFADSDSNWKESPFKTMWDKHVESLGQWRSKFGAIHGSEFIDHDTDTAIGILVKDFEMSKYRKKGILFRLLDDSEGSFRTIKTHDTELAMRELNKHFGQNKFELI